MPPAGVGTLALQPDSVNGEKGAWPRTRWPADPLRERLRGYHPDESGCYMKRRRRAISRGKDSTVYQECTFSGLWRGFWGPAVHLRRISGLDNPSIQAGSRGSLPLVPDERGCTSGRPGVYPAVYRKCTARYTRGVLFSRIQTEEMTLTPPYGCPRHFLLGVPAGHLTSAHSGE